MFKLQVQDDDNDPNIWHDVSNSEGSLLTFASSDDARTRLEELFPVLVKVAHYAAGPKRTRVINIIEDEDDWQSGEKTEPT